MAHDLHRHEIHVAWALHPGLQDGNHRASCHCPSARHLPQGLRDHRTDEQTKLLSASSPSPFPTKSPPVLELLLDSEQRLWRETLSGLKKQFFLWVSSFGGIHCEEGLPWGAACYTSSSQNHASIITALHFYRSQPNLRGWASLQDRHPAARVCSLTTRLHHLLWAGRGSALPG